MIAKAGFQNYLMAQTMKPICRQINLLFLLAINIAELAIANPNPQESKDPTQSTEVIRKDRTSKDNLSSNTFSLS